MSLSLRVIFLYSQEPLLGEESSPDWLPSPEARASFWGLLTFSWMYPLISKGNKQQLQASDVYELMPKDTTEVSREGSQPPLCGAADLCWSSFANASRASDSLLATFLPLHAFSLYFAPFFLYQAQVEAVLATWTAEEVAARRPRGGSGGGHHLRGPSSHAVSTEASETSTSLLSPAERENSNSISSTNNTTTSGIRLFRVLCRTYGGTCLGSAFLKLVYDLLQFVGPVILQQIILFLQQSADK